MRNKLNLDCPDDGWRARSLGALPLIGAVLSTVVIIALRNSDQDWSTRWVEFAEGLLHPFQILVLVQTAYTALLGVLWMRYRRFVAPSDAIQPKVSVIIPAFNEGPMVERSIRSVAKSNYPIEKLEIIVVDDGSRDDTFFHMRHLRREFPNLVRLVRFAGNRGKRAALYEGFKAARGEIVITIDSDS